MEIHVKDERIEKIKSYHCAVEVALHTIGGKYKAIILFHLIGQTLRFNELQKRIPQATPKMLSHQLKELEADGIVKRKLYPVVPPKTEYSLSEFGVSIIPVIQPLHDWGAEYIAQIGLSEHFHL